MDIETLGKIRRHIEQTGNYEPLTVRPHPRIKRKFQIINGHNRIRVLKAIGRKSAHCIVWDINDEQTFAYLATLNRLCGKDVPERRAILLEALLEKRGINELVMLLPDDRRRIEAFNRMARLVLDDLVPLHLPSDQETRVPVVLTFMLAKAEAREVDLALDLIINTCNGIDSRGQGLLALAQFYLSHCSQPVHKLSLSINSSDAENH